MRSLLAAVLLTCFLFAQPGVAVGGSPDVAKSIDRGLEFLAKDAVAWKEEHHCVSCHHAGMVMWSMHEAKRQGHSTDEPLLAELTKWIATSGDGRVGVERPAAVPKALNTKALWFSLALATVPEPDAEVRQGFSLMRRTLLSDQTESGAWAAWPETRAPMFGPSDYGTTALAAIVLIAAADNASDNASEAGDDSEAKAALGKAAQWLDETKLDDEFQSLAMKLVVLCRLNRPLTERQALIDAIRLRQKEDGGWSQTADLASDAWATGQALYALALAGVESSDDAIHRGQHFLVRTQREDGSWPMQSRPAKAGEAGSSYLVPIIGAGSAWAVIGLARSE